MYIITGVHAGPLFISYISEHPNEVPEISSLFDPILHLPQTVLLNGLRRRHGPHLVPKIILSSWVVEAILFVKESTSERCEDRRYVSKAESHAQLIVLSAPTFKSIRRSIYGIDMVSSEKRHASQEGSVETGRRKRWQ